MIGLGWPSGKGWRLRQPLVGLCQRLRVLGGKWGRLNAPGSEDQVSDDETTPNGTAKLIDERDLGRVVRRPKAPAARTAPSVSPPPPDPPAPPRTSGVRNGTGPKAPPAPPPSLPGRLIEEVVAGLGADLPEPMTVDLPELVDESKPPPRASRTNGGVPGRVSETLATSGAPAHVGAGSPRRAPLLLTPEMSVPPTPLLLTGAVVFRSSRS